MIDLSGRVAIVTGAGRGIGRETALALARRGAKVLVNDYGGGASTAKPGSADVAEAVVAEVAALGGEAVADAQAVGTPQAAEAIVAAAMSAFGRVDILVNNAGGNITTGVEQLDDQRAETIFASNFTGGWMLLRKCWPIMREAGFGRIVNIMSGAILGLPGRGTYAAGKSAYLGLTTVAAAEGEPHDIRVNGVWPTAQTRLMDGIDDAEMIERMKGYPPHLVAEAVVWFCAPECKATGEFYDVGGGGVSRIAFTRSAGFHDPDLTAESLGKNFNKARDMTDDRILSNEQ
ncbi:MAG: SDR family NAD(P)-dependent oxidoreductase [Novosphingobium sp.]|nr:SDR family NAD(P)-dependent oxidoreductase [Novosphingobium sp.]